jgi:hypothetical protein
MLKALPILLVLLLTGCMTEKEREAKLAAADDDKCTSYGLQFGTPQYADCRIKMTQIHASEEIARKQAVAAYVDSLERRQTTTNCTRFGNTVNCQSY